MSRDKEADTKQLTLTQLWSLDFSQTPSCLRAGMMATPTLASTSHTVIVVGSEIESLLETDGVVDTEYRGKYSCSSRTSVYGAVRPDKCSHLRVWV